MHLHHALAAVDRLDPAITKFADHLDRMLAACADLAQFQPQDQSDETAGHALRVELTAITHLLQARACAREIDSDDDGLCECITLFLAGTQALEHSPASAFPDELMLGRRLAIVTAMQFGRLMLEACDALVRQPDFAAPATLPPLEPAHVAAA